MIGCSKALLGGCEGGIYDLTIEGSGHTTTGTLLELNAIVSYSLQDLRLFNNGGRGIQINGGSERLDFRNLTIFMVRWPLILAGAINESYFYDTRVMYPGLTADNYCYNVNCVNGVYPASGPIAPDPHGAIYSTGGGNEGFYGGSIKPLQMMGGFKTLVSETITLDHFYFEDGYVNAGIIAGGVMEWTATTAAMTTSSGSVSIQSTAWLPYYYTSPGDVPTTTQAAYNTFVVIPPDFLWGSTAASSLGGGITRGTYEMVALAGFAGDGNVHLGVGGRGQSGTTAIAWPAGALIEVVGTGISSFKITNSHINAQDAFSVMGAAGANLTRKCDNSGVNTCAEIIAGYIPDGRWVQQRGNAGDTSTGPPVTMNLSNLSMFTGSVSGQGLVAVHSDVALTLDGRASGPSAGEGYSVPYGASLGTVAGGAAVALPTYPNGHQPYFALTDNANQRTISSTGNLYKQAIAVYESSAHSSVGDQIAGEYDLMDQPYAAAPGTPAIVTGGTLPAGTYSFRAAYTYAGGVGILSPSVMVTVTGGQEFSVPSPPVDAAGLATGWNLYIGLSGNENLQNASPLPLGTAFSLSAAPSTNLGILPLGCSAFCHPLSRFQFLGGPNYSGASAGIGLHLWNPANSTWTTKFSVNDNGNLLTVGSGSFAAGMSVTGGTTTDTLTATGNGQCRTADIGSCDFRPDQ